MEPLFISRSLCFLPVRLAGRRHRVAISPGHRGPGQAEPQHGEPLRQAGALMSAFPEGFLYYTGPKLGGLRAFIYLDPIPTHVFHVFELRSPSSERCTGSSPSKIKTRLHNNLRNSSKLLQLVPCRVARCRDCLSSESQLSASDSQSTLLAPSLFISLM